MAGDVHIGRGSRQRQLERSLRANEDKVSEHGRAAAIQHFGEKSCRETPLKDLLWALSPVRLVCHGPPSQSCHGDEIIEEHGKLFPATFNRDE